MPNKKLAAAKDAKQDEFYTQYEDIQREINAYLEYNPDTFRGMTVLLPCDDPEWSNFTKFFAQNFELLGLKKLISTSYASSSKRKKYGDSEEYHQLSFFETEAPQFDENITDVRGKIFTLTKDENASGRIDIDDLQWNYLDGDGDFRSDEVKALRDEADMIITNPPFSLYKEFLEWITEVDKKFLIIANQNAITYKNTFFLIVQNKLWLGSSIHSGDREFRVPKSYPLNAAGQRIDEDGNKYIRVKGVRWFTNIEHGRRHRPLSLMSMADNIKFSKHKDLVGKEYSKYETFDAIDVPYYDAIPSDYKGTIGVAKTFMDFYCPEQFEILGYEREDENIQVGIRTMPEEFLALYRSQGGKGHYTKGMKMLCYINGEGEAKIPFSRILIRYTKEWIDSHPEDFKES
ncbi:MAG: adenine-specific methyltransferase EcoRI family protein [Ruminococcus sp.]|nr:adenine-specific methyltransferase EcoRI family protein [Ruminococcus sp.]